MNVGHGLAVEGTVLPVAAWLVYGKREEVGESVGGDVGHVVGPLFAGYGVDAVVVDTCGVVGGPADVGVVAPFAIDGFLHGVDGSGGAEDEAEPEDIVFSHGDFAWQFEGVAGQCCAPVEASPGESDGAFAAYGEVAEVFHGYLVARFAWQ